MDTHQGKLKHERNTPKTGRGQYLFQKLVFCSLYQVYTTYIPIILPQVDTFWPALSPSGPASLGSLRPGRLADPLRFVHRQTTFARLGAPKCPKPSVDLVNMAAFPRGRACTIGAPTLKGSPLSIGILVRNSGGGIAVQKARNEWYSPKKVFNLPT